MITADSTEINQEIISVSSQFSNNYIFPTLAENAGATHLIKGSVAPDTITRRLGLSAPYGNILGSVLEISGPA